jgi:hypothetical protein
MLILTDENFMARGTLRRCYTHPHEQGLCVKVSDATLLAIKRQQRELAYYDSLQKRNVSLHYISQYKGEVQTNLGPGYLYERIHSESGETAQTLTDLVSQRPDLHPQLFEELQRLASYLVQNRVFFHDVLGKHILCPLHTGGKGEEVISMKIVDALGDTVLIPVLNYIKPLAESKIIRRWNRYLVEPLCRQFDWIEREQVAIRRAA